jgi:NADH:ubiquinone oxidoreductase subunit 5 (subunit L)/multisubunit Na+/H+ antiporter MnhA subunit
VERYAPVKTFFLKRWLLDDLYAYLLKTVIYRIFAEPLTRNDRRVIDGGIKEFCRFTVSSGRVFSHVQAGLLRFNLMVLFVILTLVGLSFFLL